ncbi:MAG: hypothetical protein AUK21_01230 [Parcubacteria group bacterium CG2_30_48_51]|nr:MAG: hypothetical protein AUK21_01230 [Parcubacteria group bacterium CG2_30_48_51]
MLSGGLKPIVVMERVPHPARAIEGILCVQLIERAHNRKIALIDHRPIGEAGSADFKELCLFSDADFGL